MDYGRRRDEQKEAYWYTSNVPTQLIYSYHKKTTLLLLPIPRVTFWTSAVPSASHLRCTLCLDGMRYLPSIKLDVTLLPQRGDFCLHLQQVSTPAHCHAQGLFASHQSAISSVLSELELAVLVDEVRWCTPWNGDVAPATAGTASSPQPLVPHLAE